MGKVSDNQMRVLRYLEKLPGGKTTALIFNQTCGDVRVVRALFSKGLVQGDEVPARYVGLTETARAILKDSPHHGR